MKNPLTIEQIKARIATLEAQHQSNWRGGHDGTCDMNRIKKKADSRSRKKKKGKKSKRRRSNVAAGTPRGRTGRSVTLKFVSGGLPTLGKGR